MGDIRVDIPGTTKCDPVLGMELQRSTENDPVIQLTQQGYVTELLRLHQVKKTQLDKVPITKELTVYPEKPQACDPEKIREAQQITGEVLWMAQRTRPDLSYTTSIMASLRTKCPEQTIAIGAKVLGYLQRTMDYGLMINWSDKGLTMFCDAAYAPQSAHSHSGWLVTYGGVRIVWRSSRQTMITLSTAESELLSILDGAVATKGVEAILSDIGEVVEDRELASDSTSALSISSGSSSWRTRHLRIKAGWLSEQLSHGLFRATHCPGATQPADLLTKANGDAIGHLGDPRSKQTAGVYMLYEDFGKSSGCSDLLSTDGVIKGSSAGGSTLWTSTSLTSGLGYGEYPNGASHDPRWLVRVGNVQVVYGRSC